MILDEGDTVRSYTVLKEMNQGGNAISYAARSTGGEKVFFKQYNSPSIRVPWYKAYMAYQQEMKHRIESSRFHDFSYRFIEFFEHERRYYQVFEFVDTGASMEEVLAKCRERPERVPWEQRLIMAKVMLGGIHALHQARIIHSDLKPANIMLIPSKDASIKFQYRLKIIDMDFSLLADQRAPWHGDQGYMGTPGYMSPEHLRAEIPRQGSDVFTCGLMLYELLAKEGHPYRSDTWDTDNLAYRARRPTLLGPMPAPASDAAVQQIVYRCLSPGLAERPTAEDLLLVLNGRKPSGSTDTGGHSSGEDGSARAETPGHRETDPRRDTPPPAPVAPPRLVLRSAGGGELSVGVPTEIGRTLCRQFGPDSEFWTDPQFAVERDPAGEWFVLPRRGTTNETLLNGKKVTARTKLSPGDVLAVGIEAKKIVKMPLTVGIR